VTSAPQVSRESQVRLAKRVSRAIKVSLELLVLLVLLELMVLLALLALLAPLVLLALLGPLDLPDLQALLGLSARLASQQRP